MKTKQTLPENYRQIFSVNLQKDKKMALLIQLAALAIAAVMVVPALFLVPIGSLFDLSEGLGPYMFRFAMLIVGSIAYIILHEAVHGITMKLYGASRVRYGFTGLYAFAGTDDYFDKKSYIVIALAPVVVWGIVLLLLNVLLPLQWFWVVYFIQISNVSGAVGDLYVTLKFSRLPSDILVQDDGVSMRVYSAQ